MSKQPRPKYLTNEKIKDLMQNQNSEIFADSDSECEEEDKNVLFWEENDIFTSSRQISINKLLKTVSDTQEVS